MAIEKIPIRTYTINWLNVSESSVVELKINEIIDYINSKETTTSTLSVWLAGVTLITDNSGRVEQEPNKVELVPLDCRKAINDIVAFIPTKKCGKVDIPTYRWFVKRILSKYWVPTPKKRTLWEIKSFVNAWPRDSYDAWKVAGIEEFAKHIGLLEE